MTAWKYSPNTYDMNLVKLHYGNSAINSSIGIFMRCFAM